MTKRQTFFLNITIALLLPFAAPGLRAQGPSVDSLLCKGDSLRLIYRFEESISVYTEALESLGDSLRTHEDSLLKLKISDKMLLSENGKNMTRFVHSPTVIAKHKFSIDDFFLYYPLKDRSWREVPAQLDSFPDKYSKAIYAPAEDKVIYYSAADQDGIRNIYRTAFADTLWSVPTLLNEQMTSASNEIYPIVSEDGKYMYFASEGLYGVGGYDLYVSEWDEDAKDWSVPKNMGFPYSSPANDYLLVNSPDGKYTLFASDRECSSDSVWVYVLEYDNMPIRSAMEDPQELCNLSLLKPAAAKNDGASSDVKSEIPENIDTRRYMDKMAHVRALKDSLAFCESSLEELREKYSLSEVEAEKQKLVAQILDNESQIPGLQERLDVAVRELQKVEMDFLFSGVVIDPDKLLAEAEREIVTESPDYTFSKMNMGEPLTLEMEVPKSKFDYSFKILEQAQMAEDMTIPEGIVYQIQIFSAINKASMSSLKGLSPVFETRSASGRYIYRVGLFNTYSDVLAHLNKVKKLGFRSAYIVGYVDGKEMAVGKVRTTEAERKKAPVALYNVKIIPAGGETDGTAMAGIRQHAGGKDIARVEGGLIVGPFENKTEAVALVEFVEVMGYGDAELETIQNN